VKPRKFKRTFYVELRPQCSELSENGEDTWVGEFFPTVVFRFSRRICAEPMRKSGSPGEIIPHKAHITAD